ncbi:MAG: hypothetical protein WCQ00_01445 [bacterium]
MNWSIQKQLIYGITFVMILSALIGLPLYFNFFNKSPTCFDNKRNQDETGVDCGGICTKACTADVIGTPLLLWSRAFTIANGKNNLVAYLQNPNLNYISEPFSYVFNVFDDNNILLGTREGVVSATNEKNFVVFEQAFDAGQRKIGKVIFEITSPVTWIRKPSEKAKVTVSSDQIISVAGIPTLTSTITNTTVKTYTNFYVVAIVYDVDGNAKVVSRTLVDELRGNGKADVVFTWPYLTDLKYSKIELLPKI